MSGEISAREESFEGEEMTMAVEKGAEYSQEARAKEIKNDIITHSSWSVCTRRSAEGSLPGPYKDYSKFFCLLFFLTLFLVASVTQVFLSVFL